MDSIGEFGFPGGEPIHVLERSGVIFRPSGLPKNLTDHKRYTTRAERQIGNDLELTKLMNEARNILIAPTLVMTFERHAHWDEFRRKVEQQLTGEMRDLIINNPLRARSLNYLLSAIFIGLENRPDPMNFVKRAMAFTDDMRFDPKLFRSYDELTPKERLVYVNDAKRLSRDILVYFNLLEPNDYARPNNNFIS